MKKSLILILVFVCLGIASVNAENNLSNEILDGNYFNGSNYFLLPLENYGLGNETTVSSYVRTDSLNRMGIIKRGKNSDLIYDAEYALYVFNGSAFFSLGDGNSSLMVSGGNISDNKWHSIIGILRDGLIKLYVDGVFIKSKPNILNKKFQGSDVQIIGGFKEDGLYFFKGYIDEVKILNYALNDIQIINESGKKCIDVCNKQCGDNDCGRNCGNCSVDQNCMNGLCKNVSLSSFDKKSSPYGIVIFLSIVSILGILIIVVLIIFLNKFNF